MRFHEIASGLRIPVSGEEQALLNAAKSGYVRRDDLGEREQEVARRMVSRGLLNRDRLDGAVIFVSNDTPVRRD